MTGKTTSAQRDRERAVLAAVERFAPLRRLGWAFLLAWVFCVFYTNAVSGYTGAKASTLAVGAGWDLFFTGLPVSMSVVMLVLIVVLEKRWARPPSMRRCSGSRRWPPRFPRRCCSVSCPISARRLRCS